MKKSDLECDPNTGMYRLKCIAVDEWALPFHVTKTDSGTGSDMMHTADGWRGGVDEGDGWVCFQVPLKRPIYVGCFKGKQPHCHGRLFWPSTGYEAYIGTFEHGRPVSGIFINEAGFYVGQMKFYGRREGWKIYGMQADLPETGDGLCDLCMVRPALIAENHVLSPCFHASICRDCESKLVPRECPFCRTPIEALLPF